MRVAKNKRVLKSPPNKKELTEKLALAVTKRKRERKRTKDILQKKDVELTKLNKELLTFTYLFNHNIQEPLRNLQMVTSILSDQEEKHLSRQGKEYFKRLTASVKLIRNLVRDLLAYSDAKASIKYEKTDLNTILAEVRYELSEIITLKKAKIIASDLCTLKVIRFQFTTLFRDLISNSLKFNREGVPPKIVIKSRIIKGESVSTTLKGTRRKYCHLTFMDNGIGFEPHFSKMIFEIFQKLHGGKFRGTGIGLAICKKIVENHGGIIKARGELGKGATFDIYIPLKN
jgi:two-component system, chemotaxis family, CheB/CheR fusion protein